MFVCVFGDIEGLLRRVEVPGTIEGDDPIVGVQTFVCVSDIRQNLSARELLLFLCLRDDKAGTCNLALVTVKDRQLDLPKE